MTFGYFDDQEKCYVITQPETPLPWINYLGSENFFSLISNTCGGYSFYRDAKLLRLTRYRYQSVPMDSTGKYYYIKDGDVVWNPGWQPCRTTLDSYKCRHGLGYSTFTSAKNGIQACLTAFVPLGDPCELNHLTLKNITTTTKHLQLFSYVEWCLWNADDDMKNFQRNLSTGEVEVVGSALYHKTEYRERRNHYAVFAVNCPIDGFDTDRNSFVGAYRGLDAPQAVERGQCTNSIASGWFPIAAHQINLTLAPGEEKTLVFTLAYVENPAAEKWSAPGVINKTRAEQLLQKYATEKAVQGALEELQQHWDHLLGKFSVQTQDEKVNRMVNIWHPYQCMVTFNLSRSASYYESGIGRGMGFRDSCQDLLGFVHLIPQRAKERILDIASTQFPDGSAYHQYQPLTKQGNADIGSGFNDDPLWLIAAVSAYVRETGDRGILDQLVPFDQNREAPATLLEHLKRSFDFTVQHRGPHGLPLIGRADWNDCLNLNCFSEEPGESFQTFGPSDGPVAESVFIGEMFVKYGREYADLCQWVGNPAEATRARNLTDEMEQAVLKSGWDGSWFLRAYDAHGGKVGSQECAEGKIYIEPQGFGPMAGIGLTNGYAEKALNAVREHLDTKYGVMILSPPYTKYHLELGEISSYPPGYKENGGIFCHNNPWISIAETAIGRGERAFQVYKKICPAYVEVYSDIHRTEPYVYSQMVAGQDAPRFGEAKNSWLTGTAAWTYTDITQYILGLYPTLEGLSVNPCVPHDFGDFQVTREYRGAVYHITVQNPDHVEKGVRTLIVDGTPIYGCVIPWKQGKKEYQVTVVMGT